MAHIRLHVQQADGHLPMICMRCAAPATVVKAKKLHWFPRWIVYFALIAIPVVLILALVLRKSARVQAPFCNRHRWHWILQGAITWGGTIVLALLACSAFVALFVLDEMRPRPRFADTAEPFLCMGSMLAFVAWIIMLAILQSTTIRPDEITRTHILLNGVSEEFVDAVENAEIERRVRLRQWEYEDDADPTLRKPADDEGASAPRRPASTDAVEEEGRRRPAPPKDAFEE